MIQYDMMLDMYRLCHRESYECYTNDDVRFP